jgi:hypothetical protein
LGAVVRADRQAGRRLLHVEQLENQRMLSGGLQADLGHRQSQLSDGSCAFHFEPFEGTLDQWGEILETLPDREIFQTPQWIRFVAESQGAIPIIAVLKDRSDTVGYFTGLVVHKFGLQILGSPFVGWTTDCMGFNLMPGVPVCSALKALVHYAFHDLGCVHLELANSQVGREDAEKLGFQTSVYHNHVVDLTQDEDQLYQKMHPKSCRARIQKAARLGVVIEEAHDETFADDYYAQLCDVFAKQSLVPTYGVDRVQLLIRHLLPTGNLQLLRACDPQGRCIATGIFVGLNQTAYFWGNASWRQDQHFSPNEAIHWQAIRHWRQRGMKHYELGPGNYTDKYGGELSERVWCRKARYRCIGWARDCAQGAFHLHQRIAGLVEEVYTRTIHRKAA